MDDTKPQSDNPSKTLPATDNNQLDDTKPNVGEWQKSVDDTKQREQELNNSDIVMQEWRKKLLVLPSAAAALWINFDNTYEGPFQLKGQKALVKIGMGKDAYNPDERDGQSDAWMRLYCLHSEKGVTVTVAEDNDEIEKYTSDLWNCWMENPGVCHAFIVAWEHFRRKHGFEEPSRAMDSKFGPGMWIDVSDRCHPPVAPYPIPSKSIYSTDIWTKKEKEAFEEVYKHSPKHN
ncbi:hypothetical protein DM02DRAFT_703595 [Periconia macrospinosa]|uniref:Uncharacterized protein n=1 Tax=Periconia macrospinosa TaxID=97972 RepID=A0A2V1DUF6_9PLEO|nr:hypothetical protein DM02DRAFT_703595 [Periconia macrospinosa]